MLLGLHLTSLSGKCFKQMFTAEVLQKYITFKQKWSPTLFFIWMKIIQVNERYPIPGKQTDPLKQFDFTPIREMV